MIIKHIETEKEIEGKAYVHWKAWQETYEGLIDREFLGARTLEMSRHWALWAFQNNISTHIAVDSGRVTGFADYGRYRGDDLDDAGEVYAIYVLKEYYGKGVGRALMNAALREMDSFRQVAVWVLEGNGRAIRFYTKCGYRFDGRKQVIRLGEDVTEARMILDR